MVISKPVLPMVALVMTTAGLLISTALAVLVILGIIDVPWDAKVLPLVAFAGLAPFSVVGFLVAIVSCFLHRDGRSLAALLVGLLALLTTAGALFVIVATGIAKHPI